MPGWKKEKRVLLIAAGILAARKLATHEGWNAGASNRQRESRGGSLGGADNGGD
jgi:hypothetical protein